MNLCTFRVDLRYPARGSSWLRWRLQSIETISFQNMQTILMHMLQMLATDQIEDMQNLSTIKTCLLGIRSRGEKSLYRAPWKNQSDLAWTLQCNTNMQYWFKVNRKLRQLLSHQTRLIITTQSKWQYRFDTVSKITLKFHFNTHSTLFIGSTTARKFAKERLEIRLNFKINWYTTTFVTVPPVTQWYTH